MNSAPKPRPTMAIFVFLLTRRLRRRGVNGESFSMAALYRVFIGKPECDRAEMLRLPMNVEPTPPAPAQGQMGIRSGFRTRKDRFPRLRGGRPSGRHLAILVLRNCGAGRFRAVLAIPRVVRGSRVPSSAFAFLVADAI